MRVTVLRGVGIAVGLGVLVGGSFWLGQIGSRKRQRQAPVHVPEGSPQVRRRIGESKPEQQAGGTPTDADIRDSELPDALETLASLEGLLEEKRAEIQKKSSWYDDDSEQMETFRAQETALRYRVMAAAKEAVASVKAELDGIDRAWQEGEQRGWKAGHPEMLKLGQMRGETERRLRHAESAHVDEVEDYITRAELSTADESYHQAIKIIQKALGKRPWDKRLADYLEQLRDRQSRAPGRFRFADGVVSRIYHGGGRGRREIEVNGVTYELQGPRYHSKSKAYPNRRVIDEIYYRTVKLPPGEYEVAARAFMPTPWPDGPLEAWCTAKKTIRLEPDSEVTWVLRWKPGYGRQFLIE